MCYGGGGCTCCCCCCRRHVIVMAGVAALPCVMVVVVALHVDSSVKKNVSNVFFLKKKEIKTYQASRRSISRSCYCYCFCCCCFVLGGCCYRRTVWLYHRAGVAIATLPCAMVAVVVVALYADSSVKTNVSNGFFKKKNVPSLETQRLEVLLLPLLPFCVGGGGCCYRRTVPVWLYRRAGVAVLRRCRVLWWS
jgi:hypothetical protein